MAAADGQLSAAAAAADAGVLTPTARGWLDRNLRSIGRDVRRGVKDVGKFFKRTGDKLAKAVRDVGRAVRKAGEDAAKALSKAGKDVRRFVEKRVGDVRDLGRTIQAGVERALSQAKDTLRCVRGSHKCPKSIAETEAAAAASLAALRPSVAQAQAELDAQTAAVLAQHKGLTQLLATMPPPLAPYVRDFIYPGPTRQGQAALSIAVEVQGSLGGTVAANVALTVEDLDAAAAARPSSASLLATAQAGQQLLVTFSTARNSLADAMEALSATLETVEAATKA